MNIYISIIESIYLLYMFNYFKTNYYISHIFDTTTSKISFIKHDLSNEYKTKICKLGNIIGYISPLWFIGRHYIDDIKYAKKLNSMLITILFIGCLLTNMNAFIYSLPIFIIEYYNV